MDIKTLDDRIRAKARDDYKREVKTAVDAVRALVSNESAVKGVKHEGKDIPEKRLLEVLEQHLVRTQSFKAEEDAVADFMHKYELHLEGGAEFPIQHVQE